jgi:hypothetical protein
MASLMDLAIHADGRVTRAIYNLYRSIKNLEAIFPRTPEIEAEIEESKCLVLELKQARKTPGFLDSLAMSPVVELKEKIDNQLHAPKDKKNKALLRYCKELMQKNRYTSAAHLRKSFPLREKPAIVEGNQIFKEDKDGTETVFIVKADGTQVTVGPRAFSNYFRNLQET